MNPKSGNVVFSIILITSVILLPVLMGASTVDFSEDDDLVGEISITRTFSAAWIRIPTHQLLNLLGQELSIFTLFVIYLGGRFKQRRFNDRTIDPNNILTAEIFLETALSEPSLILYSLSSLSYLRFTSTVTLIHVFVPLQFLVEGVRYDEFDC